MQKVKKVILDIFFLLGERVAIISVFFVGSIFLFTQNSVLVLPQTQIAHAATISVSTNVGQNLDVPTVTPTSTPTPTPTVTPTPTPTAIPTPTVDPTNNTVWDQLAQCESNQHWNDDTGNGYYGGLQFNQSAWNSVGGSGNPAQASRDEQIMRGKMLQARRGWGPWGACARKLGLD